MQGIDWVHSFVHRSLRRTAGYIDGIASAAAAAIPCDRDEVLVGVYENAPGEVAGAIGITDRGLHIHQGPAWRFIEYKEIDGAVLPCKSKGPPFVLPYLDLRLHSGEVIRLPVLGRTGQAGECSDVYGMESFLRGMLCYIVRSHANA